MTEASATVAPVAQAPFSQANCGIAVLDPQGRLQWTNPALSTLLDLGHQGEGNSAPITLPEPLLQPPGSQPHTFSLTDRRGRVRWLQAESNQAEDNIFVLVRDVTEQQRLRQENERLRRQVEALKLTDDLTGMPNRRAIAQALELQVSRSRRYRNPLSVVMARVGVEDPRPLANGDGLDKLVLSVSRFLRDRLRWVDQIGRWEDNLYVLVLPETSHEDAQNLVTNISNDQDAIHLPEPWSAIHPHLSFGIACWQKGDDMRTLLRKVAQDLDA